MTIFDINDVAKIGSVRDVPGYQLPPEIWTLAKNMRYESEGIVGLDGWGQTFGTPLFAPHFVIPVSTNPTVYWLYTSLTRAAVYDGVAHTDLTRLVGGNYSASDSQNWNGTLFGNIAIINNVNDVPQYWAVPSTGTNLADLPNWPSTLRARVLRSFGPFLIAVSTVESGTEHPHRIQWSHPAAPGEVPSSWAVNDPDFDGGNIDFPDVAAGVLADALPLASNLFVYKEASVWKARFIGGQSKFDWGQSSWLTTAGLLSPRCVCITGDGTKHVLATQDDIIWHNGSKVQSVLSLRQRKRLQSEIDPASFGTSFMFSNPYNSEIWFCYPSAGSTYPNLALILNYKAAGGEEFVVTEADGIDFRNAAFGTIESFVPEQWNQGTDTWEDYTGPWAELERRRVVLCNPTKSKFFMLGSSATRDGAPVVQTLTRDGLALIGKKRDGSPIVDHQKWKMLKRLWPKIIGDPVRVRFGRQETVNGPVMWGTHVDFTPNSDVYCDPGPVSGRAVGFELSATSAQWRLDGYKIDMVPMGEF